MTKSYTCKECGFDLWLYVTGPQAMNQLAVSHLGLYNDGRFPGRALLVLENHHEDFGNLEITQMESFMQDVQVAGRAIQKAVGAVRMNYAILGNAVPHVHCHIIPRFGDGIDPGYKTTPWSTNTKAWQMEKSKVNAIMASIRKEMT
jgi:diadenosine tetraphosphate (Ap4A) HIT family hydrolase